VNNDTLWNIGSRESVSEVLIYDPGLCQYRLCPPRPSTNVAASAHII